jgi:6-phosphofructokinase 1
MRIGILTSGGDCPGLNAAIRGVGKTAILKYGMEVIGITSGYQGLILKEVVDLDERKLSGILTLGGTILGTSREKPFKDTTDSKYALSKPELIRKHYDDLGLDCIVCIGGNGTQKTAHKLAKYGLNVVGVPKTIDNDVWGTDRSFGFDSAVTIVTEALDRLHTTANSHRRIMVIEVMGHHAGWLALYSGISGGGDAILIPEIEYSEKVLAEYLDERARVGKPYSIVIAAEGIHVPEAHDACGEPISAGHYIAKTIKDMTGLETRETILGYIQRGGTPSPFDRILASRLGTHAAELIARGEFGRMVALKGDAIDSIPLSETAGKVKTVPVDDPMIREAKSLGTCFGDE